MVKRVEIDVRIGLWTEATLEAGNDIIIQHPRRKWPGGKAYETIAQSLAVNLSIALARLFDPGSKNRPPNSRDIASIPLMVRLLKQKRCQSALIDRARMWTPMLPDLADAQAEACRTAITKACKIYGALNRDHLARSMLRRLRDLRNYRLAHTMWDEKLKAPPLYNELFRLMDTARDIADAATFAVAGNNLEFRELEEGYREHASEFWRSALRVQTPVA